MCNNRMHLRLRSVSLAERMKHDAKKANSLLSLTSYLFYSKAMNMQTFGSKRKLVVQMVVS